MKILIYSVLYPNAVQTTYGIFVKERVRFLKNFCEVKVVAPIPYFPNIGIFKRWAKFSNIPKYEVIDGIEVYHPRFLLFPQNIIRLYVGFLMYLSTRSVVNKIRRNYKFDLIHAHFAVPAGIAASYLSKMLNVPFIITEHYGRLHKDLAMKSKIRKKVITAYKKSSQIIAVSPKIENDLLKAGIKKNKIKIIANGVDCARFPFVPINKNMDPVMLLSIGGLIESKGYKFLIKAVKILRNENLNVELKIIGEGRNRKQLEKLIKRLDINDYVGLEGNIIHSELKNYFKQTHIFVLPSLIESFSVVTIEALSCGIPVVVTRCGGPEFFVNNESGLVIQKEDEKILADSIKYIIENYNRYDKSKIREICYNKFDLKKIAKDIYVTYLTIMHEHE